MIIETQWFVTWGEFTAWRASLPTEHRVDAVLYAHVGHTPMEFLPNDCTVCALNESMEQLLRGEGRVLVCRHGVQLSVEDCDVGCSGSSDA